MIPIQYLAECIARRTDSGKGLLSLMKDTARTCRSDLLESIYELQRQVLGQQHSDAALLLLSCRFITHTMLWLAILLTIPAYLWYVSVNLTSMSNLTAIYNTGCFFAYLFSIWMLGDRLVATKLVAVVLCMAGVFAMAFWPSDSTDQDAESPSSGEERQDGMDSYSSALGILVAVVGAAAYGFYEVYYKKYATPPRPTILFANAVTGVIGIITLLLLWIPLPFLHWSGYETFELPDATTFMYVLGIASMSVVYNATFMCVIALVNPVFAAVGVMLTVPAVAVTDVLVTGVMVPASTVIGSILILIGFYILSREIAKEQQFDHLSQEDD